MKVLCIPEAYRAERRLTAAGAGDFHGENFIGGVAPM